MNPQREVLIPASATVMRRQHPLAAAFEELEAVRQDLEQRDQLTASQRSAYAEVGAVTEGEMTSIGTVNLEHVRVCKCR